MSRILPLAAISIAAILSGCTHQPAQNPPAAPPTIVFMTDFGTANDSVAICKAVIIGIAPGVRIMDITHQVTPFSIEEGARFLAGVSRYYPSGTIFLAVVDPGVGTSRKAVVVKTKKGQFFVLPDNGLITPVLDRDGLDAAREITNTSWMLTPGVSSTNAGGITGEIIALDDPYGSLITDIPGDEFRKLGYALGDTVTLRLGDKPFTASYVKTFMDVAVGRPLLYVDSRGQMGLALNQRNFSRTYGIAPPTPIFIPRKR